jgi:hypothetical protein
MYDSYKQQAISSINTVNLFLHNKILSYKIQEKKLKVVGKTLRKKKILKTIISSQLYSLVG